MGRTESQFRFASQAAIPASKRRVGERKEHLGVLVGRVIISLAHELTKQAPVTGGQFRVGSIRTVVGLDPHIVIQALVIPDNGIDLLNIVIIWLAIIIEVIHYCNSRKIMIGCGADESS